MEALKMMSESEAYIEGFHDREFGYKDRNPYKRYNQDFIDYRNGWYIADKSIKELQKIKQEQDERD